MTKRKMMTGVLAGGGVLVLAGMTAQAAEAINYETLSEEAVLYDANEVKVTATLAKEPNSDKNIVLCKIQNNSEYPVLMENTKLVANDVTFEDGYSDPADAMLYSLQTSGEMMEYGLFSSLDELLEFSDLTSVPAGAEGEMQITVDNLGMLKDLFSYDSIQQLQVSVTLVGLKEELSEDHLALTSEDVAFSETGALTDFTIPGSTWDGTWADIDGTVLYEGSDMRVIGAAPLFWNDGEFRYFRLVLENRSENKLSMDTVYEGTAELNGLTSDFAIVTGCALPGTRAICDLSADLPDDQKVTDLVSGCFDLEVRNDDTYETICTFTYNYGDSSASAAPAKTDEDTAAEEQAAVEEELGFTVEDQTIYDANDIVIKTIGVEKNHLGNIALNVEITNNQDQNVFMTMAAADGSVFGEGCYAYINGYQVTGNAYDTIPAHETIQDTIFLDPSVVKAAGMENIGELAFELAFCDEESYELLADLQLTTVHTSKYDEMDTELGADMQKIYEGNGFTAYAKYCKAEEVDPNYEQGLQDVEGYIICAIRNDSDTGAGLHINEFLINGVKDENMYYYEYENAGKTYLDAYPIEKDFLDTNGISAIESLSMKIDVNGPGVHDMTTVFSMGSVSVPLN